MTKLVQNNKFYFSKRDYISLLLLLFITISLSAIGFYSLVNMIWFLFTLICFIKNKELLYLLYIILLPTNGIISTEYNLFGFIFTLYLTNLFTFISLFRNRKYIKDDKSGLKIKRIGNIVIVLFFFILAKTVRGEYLHSEIPLDLVFTRTIKLIVQFFSLYFIVKLSILDKYRSIIETGFLIGAVILGLSIIFSDQLYLLGLNTYYGEFLSGESSWRASGFYGFFGNSNGAGAFLAFAASYITYIMFFSKKKLNFSIALLIVLIGIFRTGSRAAIIGYLIFVGGIIIITKFSLKQRISILISLFLIVISISQIEYFENTLARFNSVVEEKEGGFLDTEHEYGRLGGWILYFDYMVKNPSIFLIGTHESLYENENIGTNRDGHNFYVMIIYNWGLLVFCYLISQYGRYLKVVKIKSPSGILFIVLFFISNTGSGLGSFLGFILTATIIRDRNTYINKHSEIPYI